MIKRFFLGIMALALIVYAAISDKPTILIIGILTLIPIMFLKPKALIQIIVAIIKKKYNVDILEEVKQNLVSEIKQKYTKINDTEINKIYAADSSNAISATISNIVLNHLKEMCTNCGSENVVQIPWESDFDKLLDKKVSLSEPIAYHCKNCGVKYIKYTTN